MNIHELKKNFSEEEIREAISKLSDEQVKALMADYKFWARPEQIMPEDEDWYGYLILAGRGFGKTWTGSQWIIDRAKRGLGPIGLIGQTAGDVRDVMVEAGTSSIIQLSPKDFMPVYEPSKRRLTWPNGVFATTFSGDEPGQLRGPQFSSVWADEPAKWAAPDETFDQMRFGLRIGKDPRFIATTTPLPIPLIKSLYEDPKVKVITGSTFDNAANLSDNFLTEVKKKYEGTRLGRQELYGEILWEVEGALFSQEEIDKYRVPDYPLPDKIVVAVDPAIEVKRDSDETGIIVASRTGDHGYCLADATVKATPSGWARRVGNLCEMYDTNIVVAESNQGGLMVEETIRSNTNGLVVKLVKATQGKLARAEPISLLAEQGRIHMVGTHEVLENQLSTYDGKGKSPNNFDAFIWAMHELMLGKKRTVTSSEFYL